MQAAMVIDQMNPVLYKAAVKGNVEDYHEALRQMPEEEARRRQVTPKGNTVLHVAAIHGHKHLVEEILREVEDNDNDNNAAMSLLFAKNNRNESALHCAAEKGHDGVVSAIFSAINKKREDVESAGGRVREMIEMTDDVKDTALHKAVRMGGHLEVAKLLIQEDPEFEYLANDDGETPIYIAAELQFHGCLEEMLNKCQKPTYGGPLGRNALHAAILSGLTGLDNIFFVKSMISFAKFIPPIQRFSSECTQSLLKKKICLCEEIDKSGWTPLHYAVKIENDEAVRMILERKTSAAYICAGGDKAEWTTTFHIAAKHGKVEMMKEISNRCPDCWDMVNSKGQNVLHEAILSKQVNVIRHIKQSSDQFENLVTHKDEDGNTPLHMLAVIDCSIMHRFITKRPMLNYFAFNKKHQTLFDIAFLERNKLDIGYEKLIKGKRTLLNSRKFADRMIQNPEHRVNIIPTEENRLEAIIGMGKSSIVVATLILTMTFAAGITVPGGYHQEKGYPLLLRNAAFKAFITTNTFSFLCSFCSIAVHIAMVSEASRYLRSFETVARLNFLQGALLLYSCYGVVIAFLCAMYATLAPLRPLAIADLILGFSIVIIAYCAYRLLWLCGCRPPY